MSEPAEYAPHPARAAGAAPPSPRRRGEGKSGEARVMEAQTPPRRAARADPPLKGRDKKVGPALSLPYLWLVAFFLVPFLIVLKISLAQTAIAMPPYVPVLDLAAGWQGLVAFAHGLTLDGYRLIASDPLYLSSYLKSLKVGAVSTAILLALGYPMAYGIAQQPAPLAGAAGDGGGAAVLDLVPHPRLCLDQHPAARRPVQRPADGAARHRQAGGLARLRHRHLYRPRLFLPAVHGAAALRHAGEDGRLAARSRRRSRLHAQPRRSGG